MYNIKKRLSFINYTRVGAWETLLHKGWASNDKRSARSEAGKLLPCKGNRESRIKLINNSLFKYRFYLSIITCIKHVFYQKHKHDQVQVLINTCSVGFTILYYFKKCILTLCFSSLNYIYLLSIYFWIEIK